MWILQLIVVRPLVFKKHIPRFFEKQVSSGYILITLFSEKENQYDFDIRFIL